MWTDRWFNRESDLINLTNQLALFSVGINLVGLMVSIVFFEFFAPLFFISLLMCIGSLALNQYGKHSQAKLLLCLNAIFLPFFIHTVATTKEDDFANGLAIFIIFGWIMPIVIHSFKEWLVMSVLTATAILIFWIVDSASPLIDVGFDVWLLRQSHFEKIFVSIFGVFVLIIILILKISYEKGLEELKTLKNELQEIKNQYQKLETAFQETDQERQLYKSQSEQRKWLVETLSVFNHMFRKNDESFEELCNQLVATLNREIKGCQTFLFLVKDKKLILAAAYAYQRKKYLQKEIPLNKNYADSLLTQVYLTKEEIVIENLPNGYTEITSGIGEITPQNLLIAPIKLGEIVLGILEIASFKEFTPVQKELILGICDSFSYIVFNKFSVYEDLSISQRER